MIYTITTSTSLQGATVDNLYIQ